MQGFRPSESVKPKFQVTIPATLRRGIDLREGDIMEATLVGDGILFRPKEVVDRDAAANRIAAKFATARPSPEDVGRSEDEIMSDSIAEIATSRRERRLRDTLGSSWTATFSCWRRELTTPAVRSSTGLCAGTKSSCPSPSCPNTKRAPDGADRHRIVTPWISSFKRLSGWLSASRRRTSCSVSATPPMTCILATATAGGAVLITGNTPDYTEERYGAVEVWSPRAFLGRTK